MTKLPDGWAWTTIAEVCEKPKYGWTTSASDFGEVKLLRTTDLTHGPITWETVPFCKETPKTVADYEVHPNDIFISRAGSVGVSVLVKDVPFKAVFASYLIRIRPTNKIDAKYLSLFLQSPHYWNQVSELSSGIALANINATKIQSMSLPLPPIDEQHKIVELLEDHLSRLDAALTDVKQAKIKAAQFRRSFVHEMTTAIESSEVMGILDICDVYQPKTISIKELIADGEFPVYGANGQIGFYDKFNHEDSEVTVTCRGATCGTVNVIPAMSWITGNAMVFRPKDSRIQKGFLEYVLRGMDWTPVITGTAQPQITRTSIQDVFVNVPSPDVQGEIYMKLESSLTQVTNAELLSKKVEMQAANLRRSLLQAAFTGQLTKEVVSV